MFKNHHYRETKQFALQESKNYALPAYLDSQHCLTAQTAVLQDGSSVVLPPKKQITKQTALANKKPQRPPPSATSRKIIHIHAVNQIKSINQSSLTFSLRTSQLTVQVAVPPQTQLHWPHPRAFSVSWGPCTSSAPTA